jgi:DNA-binding CsgD family transcriptional regulator/tetratricopeptide (TPR) repeat protein
VGADGALIGRQAETARLRQLLADAAGGRGSALAVVADAGVGKSALLDHVLADRPAGMTAARVTGVEVESELAHVGLATLLAQAEPTLAGLDPASAGVLRAVTGGGAAPDAPAATFGLAVHMAALALVTAMARPQPLVIVLDDVHWIDPASLAVLTFVARRVAHDPVAVLLAGRPAAAVAPALAGIDRLELGPLPAGDAGTLLARHGVAPRVAAECWEATGGNPLALVGLAAALGPDERTGRAPLPDPIPLAGPLREMFARRLRPLAATTRRAMAVAAVEATGAPAVVARALAAAGRTYADLRPAEDAGLVRNAGGTLRWEHPLARAAVLDALAPADRRSAHRAVAAGLLAGDTDHTGAEHTGDGERRTQGSEARVAFHLAAAAEGPDEGVAARLVAVARHATERGALQAAARAWDAAAELSVDDDARFERRRTSIEARWLAGETEAVLQAALPLIEAEPDPARRAKLAILVGQAMMWWEGPLAAARYLTAEGDRARSHDPTSAGYLHLYAAQAHLLAVGPRSVVDVAERAGADGLAAGDMGVALMAQALAALGRLLLGHVEEARQKMDPLVELCPGLLTAQIEGASSMAQVLSFGLVADERWDEARTLIEGIISEGQRTGHIGMTVLAHDQMGELEWRQGRWAEAASRLTHALTLAEGQDQDQALIHQGRLRLARIDAGRGRTAEARSVARAALEVAQPAGWRSLVIWSHEVLALAGAADDDPADVLRNLDAMAVLTADVGVRQPGLLWWQAAHVEALVARGRTADAEAALDRLRAETALTGGRWAAAAVARGEAALAAAASTPDRAVLRLDDAAALLADLGAGFELAQVLLARGRAHRMAAERLDPGASAAADRAGAHRVAADRDLAEAHARFVHLDARPWAGRAARLAGPAAPARPKRSLAGILTDAELRVALVVGGGATNRDAADQLFLSIKTVDSHLQSIYRRLAIRSRSQLAGLVARELGPDG